VAGALVLVGTTGTAAFATSLAPRSQSPGPVAITLWESHNGYPAGDAMTVLANRFNATHKSIKLTIVVTKASTKLLAAIPTGTTPALAEISHYDGVYVKPGALLSWNGFMKGSSVVNQSNFVPSAWTNGEVGGQHYRLQASLKVSEVFYNMTMFHKAGITSAPTTWTQLATDAALIKAKIPGVIPLGWKNASAHELPAFLSDGGTLLKGGNSVGHAVNFNTPAGVESFSYFRSLYAANELQLHHGTTLREDFGASKMAMIDATSAGYAKALAAVGGKFKVGAFVEPAGSTGHAYNIAQGLGFVLPKGHSHAQDEAAWAFVQWWFEPAQQDYWAEQTGFSPETHAAITAIPTTFLATHPGLVVSMQAAVSPYTLPRPVSDSYNEVQAALDTEWFNAVTGKQSVAAALKTLEQQGNGYMSGASEI
jgi:ABC-type glycerol-3-phosphate transport system substrate-binding protein